MWKDQIIEAAKASGLSHAELASIAGCHRPAMTVFMNGGGSVHMEKLEVLCDHLGLTLCRGGVPMPREEKPTEEPGPCLRCVEREESDRIHAEATRNLPAVVNVPHGKPAASRTAQEAFRPRRSPRDQAKVESWRKP